MGIAAEATRRKDQACKQQRTETGGQLQLNHAGFIIHRSTDNVKDRRVKCSIKIDSRAIVLQKERVTCCDLPLTKATSQKHPL